MGNDPCRSPVLPAPIYHKYAQHQGMLLAVGIAIVVKTQISQNVDALLKLGKHEIADKIKQQDHPTGF